jgi:hypothetical protein
MKLSTLMLASLMTMASATAFAEGGSERSKQFYDNFTFMQKQVHGDTAQTAMADGKNPKKEAADNSTVEQQPNT